MGTKTSETQTNTTQSRAAAEHASGQAPPAVIRKEPGKAIPAAEETEEKLKAAALKVGEAFLKTETAQKLIEDDALVRAGKKTAKDFLATWYGKIISGVAVAGYVGGFATAKTKLPIQLPALPLDFIREGLSLQLKSEGPVNDKPDFSVTIQFTEPVKKRPLASSSEKSGTEIERLREENARFQERFKTTDQRKQDAMMDKYLHDQMMERMGKMLNLPKKEEKKE